MLTELGRQPSGLAHAATRVDSSGRECVGCPWTCGVHLSREAVTSQERGKKAPMGAGHPGQMAGQGMSPAEGNGAHIILKDAAQERFLAKGL